MDISALLIDSFLWKFRAEKKWTSQAIAQLSEEDITWAPTPESNSIANLVAHIWGTVHSRVEIAFFDVPLVRGEKERAKEFEKELKMSKANALELIAKSFDMIIQVLEEMKSNPEQGLLRQPYKNMQALYYSALKNDSTVLDIMMQMLNHLSGHTAQITYIAKMRKGQLQWQYD
jgi:uncharacterized damage-inducible protein DinB